MKQVTATVISNERLWGEFSPPGRRKLLGTWLIWLKCPDLALEARPGQFVMVRCGEDCTLPRPFSIHRAKGKNIALFYAAWEDGRGTDWLSRRNLSDKIDIFGPLGNGFSVLPESKNLLLVAGGMGIAPLVFSAQYYQKLGFKVRLLQGASGAYKPSGEPNPSQLYPQKLLPKGVEVTTITTSPDGKTKMVLDLITPQIAGSADQIFACGPMAMYRDMVRNKQKLGLEGKPVQVSLEVRMGCGRGVCYSCTVKTKSGLKQVCQDGPVFNLDEIIESELPFI